MSLKPAFLLLCSAILAGCALPPPPMAAPGPGGNFAAFGEDENACREAGAAALSAPSAPESDAAANAHRYDYAYQRCMFMHGQARQMRAMTADDPGPRGNVHSFEYPDAFYAIPYDTPGYGYDGFSWR
jgi:hypothetical protein